MNETQTNDMTVDRTSENNEKERKNEDNNIGVSTEPNQGVDDKDSDKQDQTTIEVIPSGKETIVNTEKDKTSRERKSREEQGVENKEYVQEQEDTVNEILNDESDSVSKNMEDDSTKSNEMVRDTDHVESRKVVIQVKLQIRKKQEF